MSHNNQAIQSQVSHSLGVRQAFESFMKEQLESAVDSSTEASWGGRCCFVELFNDGTYRVLWSNQIGDLYDSPGLLLPVPSLGDDDWDEDPSIRFYGNAEEDIRDSFQHPYPEI